MSTFSYESLLSIENILADAIMFTGDPDMRLLNKGFYVRQAKAGLDEMNFETFFDVRYQDLEIAENLKMPFPSGAWNLRDMFVFNTDLPASITTQDGATVVIPADSTVPAQQGGCCKIIESMRVVHKNNFLSNGYNNGYTARNKTRQYDYFIMPFSQDANLCFYNIQNGMIMLSDYCKRFKYIRIVYNGTASDIDKAKMIPPFIRTAIVGYVVERALFALKARDGAYRIQWMDARADLYTPPSRTESSRWDEAKYRIKTMDKKQADDLKEYLSRGSW